MQQEPIEIKIYDKREGVTTSLYVEQLSNNLFRAVENDIFNCKLTFGTEFETKVNMEGIHEIIKITKDSEFITRRFLLSIEFTESEYRLLGDEIVKNGGFWQTDFGGIATINLPKDCKLDIEEIFKIYNFKPTEIKD